MSRPGLLRTALCALALLTAIGVAPSADAGEVAPRQPVLIVDTQEGTAVFDLAQLQSLGTVTIETTTPWSEGVQRFEGVPVRRLLDALGARGETVMARAANNYVALIPVDDLRKYDVILAFRQNGKLLDASDTGPLFLVYPYDRDAALRHEQTYARSVWQLTELHVL